MEKPRIVVVEDEPAIRETIVFALSSEGMEPVGLGLGQALLAHLEKGTRTDLVILDVGLPDVNGIDLLKRVRATSRVPIILLTARNAELDRVLGLELGSDDYVTKPFSPRELSARVRAVLRRVDGGSRPAAPSGPIAFAVSAEKRQITYFGALLTLSRTEFELLSTLIERPGRVFTRETLMQRVWEDPAQSLDRTVDAHVKNLRAKLRAVRDDVDPIVTHRGTGYSLREDL